MFFNLVSLWDSLKSFSSYFDEQSLKPSFTPDMRYIQTCLLFQATGNDIKHFNIGKPLIIDPNKPFKASIQYTVLDLMHINAISIIYFD